MKYVIYNAAGYNEGIYPSDCSLGNSKGDADLASYLADLGAQPGERWFARLLDERESESEFMGLFLIDIDAAQVVPTPSIAVRVT